MQKLDWKTCHNKNQNPQMETLMQYLMLFKKGLVFNGVS
jgi:hypothetical protein